ncbi:hypothetical protein PU630_06530 [Microbacterium horticulturae]|uniref:Uncharacterized protein n=1 Tax=Microbacterium horticulturae TaxID=3028316 RepID=A0ABY8C1C1_9MICO|nr:hypothetical protein [Microbacterium sp. KACC 23027]WEG10204.1 hypothetical protein PU630_06530 [Microbacterium sp. KACC 23027]
MTRDQDVRISVGRTVPLWSLRAAGVVVAAASFFLVPVPYAIIVVCLATVGAAVPATFTTWAAIAVLALAELGQAPDAGASVFLLVAHLLHVIGGLQLALPWKGRLQLRALAAPARRWLMLQVPAQVLLVLALLARSLPLSGVLPAGAVVVVTAAAIVLMVVLVRVLAARR